MIAIAIMATFSPIGHHPAEAASTRICQRTQCVVITKGATERGVCYTAAPLASHRVYSGSATMTFTTASSLSTTTSVTFGLKTSEIAAAVGMSVTNQLTTGFGVTVGPIRAGQTGYLYSRVNRTMYTAEQYRGGTLVSRRTGVAVEPLRGQFCSAVYNF